jgi:hypothetical protein
LLVGSGCSAMVEGGWLACLCPAVSVRFVMCLDHGKFKHTYEEKRRKHDRWNACDVDGDVDLCCMSMRQSWLGKATADVLKSEEHLCLLNAGANTRLSPDESSRII